jgi:hypothetical protein
MSNTPPVSRFLLRSTLATYPLLGRPAVTAPRSRRPVARAGSCAASLLLVRRDGAASPTPALVASTWAGVGNPLTSRERAAAVVAFHLWLLAWACASMYVIIYGE